MYVHTHAYTYKHIQADKLVYIRIFTVYKDESAKVFFITYTENF